MVQYWISEILESKRAVNTPITKKDLEEFNSNKMKHSLTSLKKHFDGRKQVGQETGAFEIGEQ